jgi:hypothetical protein
LNSGLSVAFSEPAHADTEVGFMATGRTQQNGQPASSLIRAFKAAPVIAALPAIPDVSPEQYLALRSDALYTSTGLRNMRGEARSEPADQRRWSDFTVRLQGHVWVEMGSVS